MILDHGKTFREIGRFNLAVTCVVAIIVAAYFVFYR